MATYVVLAKFTQQGITGIKDVQQRRAGAQQTAQSMGVTWKDSYLLMGRYDLIIILEAPDDAAVARFVLSLGMRGNLQTETLRAFDVAAADAIIASLP